MAELAMALTAIAISGAAGIGVGYWITAPLRNKNQ